MTREFTVIATGQVLAALGGFLGFRLLSAHITTAVWGDVLLWQTFALLANQVVVAGLAGAAARYVVVANDAGELDALLLALGWLMSAAFAIIALALVALVLTGVAAGLPDRPVALGLAATLGVIAGVTSIGDSMQNAFRQRSVVALHQSAGQWLRFLLAVALVAWLTASPETVLGGFALGSLLVLLSQLAFAARLLRQMKVRFAPGLMQRSGKWARIVAKYGWPFAAWGVLNWLQTSTERWVIERTLSASDLGVYGAAAQLSTQPMTMFWSALMQLLAPIIYRAADAEANPARARRIILGAAGLTAGLGLLLAVITGVCGEKLVGLFVAAHFHEMVRYWPAMLLVAGLSGAGQVLSIAGMVGKRTDLLIFPRLVAGIVGIALIVLLVPRLGLNGAVIASGTGAIVLCGLNARLFPHLSHAV